MTRDNRGETDFGEPADTMALEPADVVRCRECGGLVRRINHQHLVTERCRFRAGDRDNGPRENHPTTSEEYQNKYPDAPTIAPAERHRLAAKQADPEADERRRELVNMRIQGEEMSYIASTLANRYGVKESTVYSDWANRSKWMARVFDISDYHTQVVMAVAEKQNIKEEFRRAASRARSRGEPHAEINALQAASKTVDDIIGLLEEHGDGGRQVVEHRHEHSVEGQIEHTAPGEDLTDEQLKAIGSLGSDDDVIDADYEEVE